MPDYESDVSALCSNIATLDGRSAVANEQRSICIELLCSLVLSRGAELGIDGVYSEFCRLLNVADCRDKATLCARICRDSRFSRELDEKRVFGVGEPAMPGTHGKIAYVRNKRTDDAYLAFSERIRGAKAYYATSFTDACELVFDNECEFCILPIENDRDGKLYSFYSMIDRYELRICDVIKRSEDDDSESIIYALVGRSVDISFRKGGTQRFELSVSLDRAELLGNIVKAGEFLGGHIFYIGTQPVPYDDRYRYFLAMDFAVGACAPMALYMTLEYPSYSPLGLYTI